ncbi:ankyrin [Cadophora sp. DSE1049]|nr:ankyrin [Cadophora sp. DSE1049]
MGILLFIYLISNSFPADAHRDKIYQFVKSQKHFIQSIFKTLKGPSVDSLLENLFALAIEAEDLPMVKSLIKAGANVDANNCKFKHCPIPMTPLQLACLRNNATLVQELITAGAEIDAPESGWKCSAILLAIYGHEQLSIGSAIQCAAESGSFEAVQILLMHEANPDAVTKTCPHTALQIASRNGSKGIAELLIASGANVNAPPAKQFGATALQFAALGGYLGVAHLLIEHGADVNASPAEVDGRTALEGAAEYGRIDMVQFLVDAGADLSGAGDAQYERALARAYNNGHHATRRLLLSYLS